MSHIRRSILAVGFSCTILAASALIVAAQQTSNRPIPAVVVEPVAETAVEQPTVFIGRVEALEVITSLDVSNLEADKSTAFYIKGVPAGGPA